VLWLTLVGTGLYFVLGNAMGVMFLVLLPLPYTER